jgi:hypothetical protein
MTPLSLLRTALVAVLVALPTAAQQPEPTSPTPLAYLFEETRSSVTLRHAGTERDASKGDAAFAGDEVETGWFGQAVLSVPDLASRFEILPSSRVVLGGPEPGILVRLEKGRLRAIFEKLVGKEDDRLVSAPGALLAVRGTRYGLEVDRSGNATLAVFEGIVEVRPRRAGAPTLAIEAGNFCRIRRDASCESSRMPRGMNEQSWSHGGMDRMDSRDGHGESMHPSREGSGSSSGMGGHRGH